MKLKNSDIGQLGDRLASAAEAIAKAGKDLNRDLPPEVDLPTDSQFKRRIQSLRDSIDALQTVATEVLTTLEAPQHAAESHDYRSRFGDFLTEVGGAVLSAQRQLDRESEKYLEETRSDRHVLPTVFRLPKLAASMKFAFENDKERGVNLVFFSKASEARELHQQSIDFEIVSVPAPIEALRGQ